VTWGETLCRHCGFGKTSHQGASLYCIDRDQHYAPLVTQSVTSVDPDSDNPKNVGSKPELDERGFFYSPEVYPEDGF